MRSCYDNSQFFPKRGPIVTDIPYEPYTSSDGDRMMDEYFARLNEKKKKKIIKRRCQSKENKLKFEQERKKEEQFKQWIRGFNEFSEEML